MYCFKKMKKSNYPSLRLQVLLFCQDFFFKVVFRCFYSCCKHFLFFFFSSVDSNVYLVTHLAFLQVVVSVVCVRELFVGMSFSVLGYFEDQWGFGLFWLNAFSLSSKSCYLSVHLSSFQRSLQIRSCYLICLYHLPTK